MISCFKCEQVFKTIDSLAIHFKYLHNLTPSSTFFCVHCCHYFQCLRTFKKHFKKVNSCIPSFINSVENANSPKILPVTINPTEDTITNNEFEFSTKFFEEISLKFVSNLQSKSKFTRTDVQELLDEVTEILFSPIADYIEKNVTNENLLNSNSLLLFLRNPFHNCKTFYTFVKTLKNKDVWEDVNEFDIDNKIAPAFLRNEITFTEKRTKGVIMPLKFQFKKFFELPNVLNDTLENINQISTLDGKYKNIINGTLWKEKMYFHKGKNVIPYIIYFDEFEINNPLGSHKGAQAIAAFYYSFPTLPEHHLSSLNNIFPALFFKSRDKSFGNDASLKILVRDVKELEENGITIKINNNEMKIYFVLGLITGDNLGLNSILGFTKSFSSKFYCRHCLCNKDESSRLTQEIQEKLRTEINYTENINMNETPEKRLKLTGISENSIFNSISSFHVVKNFYGDIMHDLFEGVCEYDISQILLHIIETEKIISIELLNENALKTTQILHVGS